MSRQGERAIAQAVMKSLGRGAQWGIAIVTAVNGDGTLDLNFFGPIDHISRLASYTSPAVNDNVIVLHGADAGTAIVIGNII